MRKINIDKQTVVFFILAAIFLGELFLIFPWEIKKISDLAKKISKVDWKISSIEGEWLKKDEYLEDKESLKKEIKEARSRFLLLEQGSKALSFISANSKDFGIEIQSLSPGKLQDYTSTEFGTFKYLPVKVKAKGKFHNLAKFLDCLSSSQYFFETKELKILHEPPCNSIEMTICGIVEVE